MTIAASGKTLQDLGYRVTPINIDSYLNANCGSLVHNDAQNVNYDCGIHEHYLNIELAWQQHLTSGKILKYVNVNTRNGKSFGIVITLQNEQIVDTISQWISNGIRDMIVESQPEESDHEITPNQLLNCLQIELSIARIM